MCKIGIFRHEKRGPCERLINVYNALWISSDKREKKPPASKDDLDMDMDKCKLIAMPCPQYVDVETIAIRLVCSG